MVVTPVGHLAPELDPRAGTGQGPAQALHVRDARLDLELVGRTPLASAGRPASHASNASSTRAVSVRSANTCCAPAALRLRMSKEPVATATVRAPIGCAQRTSSGVSPTITTCDPG